MSGRRTSGSSKPSLGVQVLAVFSFIFQGKSQFKKCLGEHLEVPDIRLADIRGLLTLSFGRGVPETPCFTVFFEGRPPKFGGVGLQGTCLLLWAHIYRVRKISPKFSCIKFFQIRDVPTQIPGHPGHSLSKTTEKGHLHKVFVRDIPTSGSRMSQEYPAQKLYV